MINRLGSPSSEVGFDDSSSHEPSASLSPQQFERLFRDEVIGRIDSANPSELKHWERFPGPLLKRLVELNVKVYDTWDVYVVLLKNLRSKSDDIRYGEDDLSRVTRFSVERKSYGNNRILAGECDSGSSVLMKAFDEYHRSKELEAIIRQESVLVIEAIEKWESKMGPSVEIPKSLRSAYRGYAHLKIQIRTLINRFERALLNKAQPWSPTTLNSFNRSSA